MCILLRIYYINIKTYSGVEWLNKFYLTLSTRVSMKIRVVILTWVGRVSMTTLNSILTLSTRVSMKIRVVILT